MMLSVGSIIVVYLPENCCKVCLLPYVWSSPTSIRSGDIRAWELQLHSFSELADHPWTWNDIATYPTLL